MFGCTFFHHHPTFVKTHKLLYLASVIEQTYCKLKKVFNFFGGHDTFLPASQPKPDIL